MPPIKYTATIAPNTVRNGDKVRIKGILMDDAKEFSINFVNELCRNPSNITYHFKWILDENVIVENYKEDGQWIDHKEKMYDQLDGTIFELEFAFQDGYIDVYKIYENTPNRITTYEPELDINEIKSLQVWGDVKKILEITFKYA
ncbi:16 kDa beta-galactoside-binding lectin isoform 2-T6 [Cochliomyia hominivorax]